MGSRLLAAAVVLAAFLSVTLLGAMLAAPFLPGAPASLPAPTDDASPSPSASATDAVPTGPPVGLFLLRGTFDFGPCLAMELDENSYPASADAQPGAATIRWWERGTIDPGNPEACLTRSSDVGVVDATVTRVTEDDDPAGRLIGFAVAFRIPFAVNASSSFEISILLAQSTDDLIQALETSTPGAPGLVFDRVEELDPSFQPLPSPSPTPPLQPTGQFLLRGPFNAGDSCLVLVLGPDAYPADPTAEGAGTVRWWERGGADPSDEAACLSRRGEVQEVSATVLRMLVGDDPDTLFAYAVRFAVPINGVVQDVRIEIDLEQSSQDELLGSVVTPPGVPPVGFDRVDSIDPPLAPAPSP